MKLLINGQPYTAPREEELIFLQQGTELFKAEYQKLPAEYRLLLKPFVRTVLLKLEDKAREQAGRERALHFRPGRKEDAVLFLADILTEFLAEALKHVSIHIETNDTLVAALRFELESQSEAGGQMALSGNIGLRENNGAQIP